MSLFNNKQDELRKLIEEAHNHQDSDADSPEEDSYLYAEKLMDALDIDPSRRAFLHKLIPINNIMADVVTDTIDQAGEAVKARGNLDPTEMAAKSSATIGIAMAKVTEIIAEIVQTAIEDDRKKR